MHTTQATKESTFPFVMSDLKGWVFKYANGTTAQFSLKPYVSSAATQAASSTGSRVGPSLSAFCDHTPTDIPVAIFDKREQGTLSLWVAGISGARRTMNTFDYVIDGGDVLSIGQVKGNILSGDQGLAEGLRAFVSASPETKLLKIDWEDRGAPLLFPEFWTNLNERIWGDVMTCCVGGHGRSGTSFVCLTLVNAPDYDAFDAIVHLRAVHCPRAIESVAQLDYINSVAKFLGRKENAKDAMNVTDYKATFAASTKPTAVLTRAQLSELKASLAKKATK